MSSMDGERVGIAEVVVVGSDGDTSLQVGEESDGDVVEIG